MRPRGPVPRSIREDDPEPWRLGWPGTRDQPTGKLSVSARRPFGLDGKFDRADHLGMPDNLNSLAPKMVNPYRFNCSIVWPHRYWRRFPAFSLDGPSSPRLSSIRSGMSDDARQGWHGTYHEHLGIQDWNDVWVAQRSSLDCRGLPGVTRPCGAKRGRPLWLA